MNRSSCGLRENIAAGLVCLFGTAFAILILYMEKHSELVRFYAVQSLLLMCAISIIGVPTFGAGYIVGIVFYIIALVNAFQGKKYKVPLIGALAEKILS